MRVSLIAALALLLVAPGSGAQEGGVLHMTVLPYQPAAGSDVRVRFRVWSRGVPVQGAEVRFAGRRARTGPRGRASIVKPRLRPGRYVASARKDGMTTDRDRVRVRR